MSADGRILVVGTTPDYIDWIDGHYPAKAVFVTEKRLRDFSTSAAEFSAPAECNEILFERMDAKSVAELLDAHARKYSQQWTGITCFDCESLELAAELGEMLGLPFAPKQAVMACRNKRQTRCQWDAAGVRTPKSALVRDHAELMNFFGDVGGAVVIKPVAASGSELVFICRTAGDCHRSLNTLMEQMHARGGNRLFEESAVAIAEEFVEGPEFSCDFYVAGGVARVLRIAKKYLYDGPWPGVVKAYEIPGMLPAGLSMHDLTNSLYRAASSLGIINTITMTDFIINRNEACFLEMTPRPGGDCIPQMYRKSSGRDMLGLALDYARDGELPAINPHDGMRRIAGLRLFAQQDGALKNIPFDNLAGLPILETFQLGTVGRSIIMPPDNYDSWKLGHVIFAPHDSAPLEQQCDEILTHLDQGAWVE